MIESFQTADGRALTYRREGEGPVLVCHPGGPGFSSRYLDDLAGLGDAFTLVMLNPRGTAESDVPADTRAYATADYVSDLEELRAHLGLAERPNPDALRLFNEGLETWDLRPELASIEAPTLAITGDRDFITGPECADDIASGIAGAEAVIVEDCGHFTFVEQPQRFREEVTRFLAW